MKKVGSRKTRKARKRDPAKIARVVGALHFQLGLCKSKARERHLRELMGLPPTPERGQ
jgi:hypothetical protein